MMGRLPLLASSLLLLFLAACVGPRSEAPLDPPLDTAAFSPSLPVLARVSSREIGDISTRVYALILSSEAAAANNLSQLSGLGLERAQLIIERLPSGPLRIELSSALAGAWIQRDRPAEALRLLSSGVDQIILSGSGGSGAATAANGAPAVPDARTIQVLEDLIYTLFGLGNDGFDQLRRAVQRVYIIQDVSLRVSLLTRIAGEYQRRGIGQRAGLLLEQAIAALDAIPDMANRIRGYAEVANRYFRQDDEQEAVTYSNRALELFFLYDFTSIPSSLPDGLQAAIEALIEMGRVSESSQLISLLPASAQKQELLATLSRYYFSYQQQFAAELILQQIIPSWEPGLSAAQYIYPMLRATGIYSDAGDSLSAEYYLGELVTQIFADVDLGASELDDFVLSDILSQTTALAMQEYSNRILAELGDARASIPALVRAHDSASARENPAAADSILNLMLSIAQRPDAGDAVLSAVAASAAEAGNFQVFLELLERIEDPYLASITASEGGLHFSLETQSQASDRIAALIRRFSI